MIRSITRRRYAMTATLLAAGLTLTACATSDAAGTDDEGTAVEPPAGDETSLTIGIPTGWDEGIAVSNLWKVILEDQGYTVETESAEIGLLFAGLSQGGFDLMFDGWLPLTHADYWTEFGDSLTDLGVWYDDAKLTIAVNEDAPITSLADLAASAGEVENKIVGIEPGAGLTKATLEQVIPTYGLEGMDFVTSSTPAMLAELKARTGAGENVVVTLWRPHWAYDQFPIRDLEDPEGTLGAAEGIHTFGAGDIAERFPTLASWIEKFELTDEQLFSLENLMFNEDSEGYTEDSDAAVRAWLEANPEFVPTLTQ